MECVELRPCSDFADRYRFGKFLFCNDLSTQHAKYCGTNCPHVVGTVKNLRNTASTLPKSNTIKNSQVNKKGDATFSWTDKEIQLLLENVKIFKLTLEAEGVDWESLRTKYDKIMEIVHKTIPKSATLQSFHIENEYKSYTKHVLQGKKNCSDYKQAVDLGKRSGGGKIIMTFAFMIYVRTSYSSYYKFILGI